MRALKHLLKAHRSRHRSRLLACRTDQGTPDGAAAQRSQLDLLPLSALTFSVQPGLPWTLTPRKSLNTSLELHVVQGKTMRVPDAYVDLPAMAMGCIRRHADRLRRRPRQGGPLSPPVSLFKPNGPPKRPLTLQPLPIYVSCSVFKPHLATAHTTPPSSPPPTPSDTILRQDPQLHRPSHGHTAPHGTLASKLGGHRVRTISFPYNSANVDGYGKAPVPHITVHRASTARTACKPSTARRTAYHRPPRKSMLWIGLMVCTTLCD